MRDSFGSAYRYGRASQPVNTGYVQQTAAPAAPYGAAFTPGTLDKPVSGQTIEDLRKKVEAAKIKFHAADWSAPVLPPPGKVPAPYAAQETPFFTIWREYGPSPTVKHFTIQSVEDEAARLSKANPGVKFFVMSSLASAYTAKPTAPPVVFTRAYRNSN